MNVEKSIWYKAAYGWLLDYILLANGKTKYSYYLKNYGIMAYAKLSDKLNILLYKDLPNNITDAEKVYTGMLFGLRERLDKVGHISLDEIRDVAKKFQELNEKLDEIQKEAVQIFLETWKPHEFRRKYMRINDLASEPLKM